MVRRSTIERAPARTPHLDGLPRQRRRARRAQRRFARFCLLLLAVGMMVAGVALWAPANPPGQESAREPAQGSAGTVGFSAPAGPAAPGCLLPPPQDGDHRVQLSMPCPLPGADNLLAASLSNVDPPRAAAALSRWGVRAGEAAHVLLVREFPSTDALAAGALQGVLGAPLLFTDPHQLSEATAVEIARLGAPGIHIIGGETVIPAAVEQQLVAAGYRTHRDAGSTAVETAVQIAEGHIPEADAAIIVPLPDVTSVPRQAIADSVAAGGLAAARKQPVLITTPGDLSPETGAYLQRSRIREALLIGDAAALSDQVAADIRALGVGVRRIAGADRYATAVAIAAERGFASAAHAGTVVLVDAGGVGPWSSALAAPLHAARLDAPILLTAGVELPAATQAFLAPGGPQTTLVCLPGVAETACRAARIALDTG